MSDRTGFRLPGHVLNAAAERKCVLALLSAFSRRWNPRNLESLWYEPWAQILADLVAKHPSLSVAPQPYLWYDTAAEPHTTPGPAHLLSTHDEQLDLLLDDDVGNTTLDSIRSISIPSHRNRSRIPDFAITRKVSLSRSNNVSPVLPHLDRKVTYVGIPLLAELKSSGARCHDIQTSLVNAIIPMGFAREQLYKQAYHLFQMYPHQESVILVAISGFWWSYYIFPRMISEGFDAPNEEEEAEEVGGEEDERVSVQNGIHSGLREEMLDSNETPVQALQEDLYGFPLCALQDIPGYPNVHYHNVLPPGQVRLRESGWSDYLLYGTAPSNQAFSLILDRLHSIVHVHYDGRMG
ncbi:hypothetical protein JVT61DRAFT_9045 [Boletus reticuloceps]|uniref:Uncharacterized protein n=1 Tax=Boletus reticuloceps TaxID=495285 RepID=A0A8I3A671_9AGAM|nr:hypothetical protein JVT61DRAFT_9045 [Boletus reticuloceps]